MKKINYAVLGSGRQGVAAAYDLAKNGNANKVILIDINISRIFMIFEAMRPTCV